VIHVDLEKGRCKMYSVEVHADIVLPGSRDRVTRYLVFAARNSALSCMKCLEATQPGEYSPEDYFEAARISREPMGPVINERSIPSYFVLTYLRKTF
jgi:hypothetical protein